MKTFSAFILFGEGINAADVFKVTGFHRALKAYVNPDPNPDFSDDPAFEQNRGEEPEYDLYDFLNPRSLPERRYSQLMDLMNFYTLEDSFDEDKYWNYGCNCMIHGDRPLSDMGTGPGVDRIDKKCREYKLCQQCARAQHGEMCIGEFVQYKNPGTKTIGGEEHRVCRDDPGTCARALCECDLHFSKEHAKVAKFYIPEHHDMLYNADAQEILDMCIRGGKDADADRMCCGGITNAALVFNNASPNQFCCDDVVTNTTEGYSNCVPKLSKS